MKKIISAVLLLFAAALSFSAPAEAREYSAANPPKPGERARAVLRALNASQNPVYLKYRTRTEDGSATVTFASSGGMAYTDVESPGGRISTLYDARTQSVTIISHDTKSYVVAPSAPAVVPFEETLERAAGGGGFTASSGSGKINGARYDFDKIVWEDGTEETLYFLPMTDTLKWWRVNDELSEVLLRQNRLGGRDGGDALLPADDRHAQMVARERRALRGARIRKPRREGRILQNPRGLQRDEAPDVTRRVIFIKETSSSPPRL